MKQITIDAPCKINLSLDIVSRLENGYHEMDMVMQSVSLYDTLTLSLIHIFRSWKSHDNRL